MGSVFTQDEFATIAVAALEEWELTGASLQLLKYRENAVYEVIQSSGKRFALRLHRVGYHTDAELRSELQWMSALHDSGLPTPQVIRTRTGDVIAKVNASATSNAAIQIQCDLLTWVEGSAIGAIGDDLGADEQGLQESLRNVGRLAGQIHNQSQHWRLPEGFSRHAWDIEGCFGPDAHWGDWTQVRLLDDNQRSFLGKAVDVWRQTLVQFGKAPDRFGLIHADFLPENLLDDGERINLIDFDDSGFGWYMWELATNLFWYYHLPSFTLAKDTLIDGYRQVRALPEEHLQHLEGFIFMRSIVYLGWTVSRSESPDAEHFAPHLINIALQLAHKLLEEEAIQA